MAELLGACTTTDATFWWLRGFAYGLFVSACCAAFYALARVLSRP
jgi:hypothetical protein